MLYWANIRGDEKTQQIVEVLNSCRFPARQVHEIISLPRLIMDGDNLRDRVQSSMSKTKRNSLTKGVWFLV